MPVVSYEYQVFAKPAGASCNLGCQYCYYLEKGSLYPGEAPKMPDDLLESYITQHIEVSPLETVFFSWHGGEPTILGLGYFEKIIELQRKHARTGKRIVNGIQTNGTLLDEEWCSFLAEQGFYVGISLDGPEEIHDEYRRTKGGEPTHGDVIRGYRLLQRHGVQPEILCVVNEHSARDPLAVYRYFKQLGARNITFLPLVELQQGSRTRVTPRSVSPEAWGRFLCAVFDEWKQEDIGRVKVQIFEEALRTAFGQGHSLCIFRPTCGDIPVLDHNGDFYSCDHFVDGEHLLGNLRERSLIHLVEDPRLRAFGEAKRGSLPRLCIGCPVRDMCNGECPKNRFATTPDREPGLNYLCGGYRRFFTHCKPFVSEVARVWRLQSRLATSSASR
jgi:uncharacterized protein